MAESPESSTNLNAAVRNLHVKHSSSPELARHDQKTSSTLDHSPIIFDGELPFRDSNLYSFVMLWQVSEEGPSDHDKYDTRRPPLFGMSWQRCIL